MKANDNQWKDIVCETLANLFVLMFAFLFALFTWESLGSDRTVNHNLADILAEILGLIFILPQVVIQLTITPQQKDLKTIFKSFISWYLSFYIVAIVFLSYDFVYDWIDEKWADIICIAIFISALLQIAPYLYFFIKKHSTSSKIKKLKQRILKRAKRLATCAEKTPDENKVRKLRKVLIADIDSLGEYISLQGNENEEIVSLGAEVLVTLIKKLHEFENKEIDIFLLYVIDGIGEVGASIKKEGNSEIILESLKETALYIIEGNCPPERMTKFVLPMIVKIADISLTNAGRLSEMTILKSIKALDEISKTGLRHRPPKEIEYHNIVVQITRFGMFSMARNYTYATNAVFNCLNQMSQLSFRFLPQKSSPILKISDAMADLGKFATQKRNETYVFETFNSLEQIIIEVKNRPEFELDYCIACFMQLGGAVFQNMPLLEEWLCRKMKSLERNANIKLSDFFESSERIISDKSEVERRWFLDFLDFLKDCLGISDDEQPEEEVE
ncbi:MAG: hypothetical protein GXO74_11430 [Calditrichaeota bacterium]|nr:hypothetical protein [Calditrichota bacterium]